jgi:serine/threonine protein kinase
MTEQNSEYSPHKIGSGTFAQVEKIDENTVVKKYTKFHDEDGCSWYPSGIRESILLSQFHGPNMVPLKKVEFTEGGINLYMPDGGVNLFDVVNDMEGDDTLYPNNVPADPKCDNYEWHNCTTELYKKRISDLPFILSKIIPALYYLHKNNIIHNDIKPDNILINTSKNTVHLIDYSNSFFVGSNDFSKCNINTQSPEQLLSEECTAQSDIWALGMTCLYYLYNMLICDRIGRNVVDNHVRKYYTYQSEKTEWLHFDECKLSESPELCKIIKGMLMWDPKKRITSERLFYHPMFYNHKINKSISIQVFDDVTERYDNAERNNHIDKLFQYCKKIGFKECLLHSVWIYDNFMKNHLVKKEDVTSVLWACVIISASINDLFISCIYYSNDLKSTNIEARNKLNDTICDIMSFLMGRLFIVTFERICNSKNFDYNRVLNLVKSEKYFHSTHKQLSQLYDSEN